MSDLNCRDDAGTHIAEEFSWLNQFWVSNKPTKA